MTDRAPHPLKVFSIVFAGVAAAALVAGIAIGPLILFLTLSADSAWWTAAAFTAGFAWLIATIVALLAWIDRMGWSKYLPSLSVNGRQP